MGKDEELFAAAGRGDVEAIRRLLRQGANVNWHNPRDHGDTPLHEAAWKGHKDVVRALLVAGADVGAKNKDGWIPLHRAARNGCEDAVRALLEAGADTEAKQKNGWTPLHLAAGNGHRDAVRALLEAGAYVGATNKDGKTAAGLASINSHAEIVKTLEAAAMKPRTQPGTDEQLYNAASTNHVAGVQWLLLHTGANVNWHNPKQGGWAPLHIAACKGHTESVRALLEAGADVGATTNDGWTPLHNAALDGHKDLVRALLEAGADVGATTNLKSTPLHLAAHNGHTDVVRALLEAGAHVRATNNGGKTAADVTSSREISVLLEGAASNRWAPPVAPAARSVAQPQPKQPVQDVQALRLQLQPRSQSMLWAGSVRSPGVLTREQGTDEQLYNAASNNDVAGIQRLLHTGTNVNWHNPNHLDNTPLHSAAQHGHMDMVRALLEAGADVGGRNRLENTPLHLAAPNGFKDVVRALLEGGADVGATNKFENTPLHLAAHNGHTDVVHALLEAGAHVRVTNKDGDTPLHLAARKGHTAAMHTLLEAGAEVAAINKEGRKAADVASSNNHTMVVALLEAAASKLRAPPSPAASAARPVAQPQPPQHFQPTQVLPQSRPQPLLPTEGVKPLPVVPQPPQPPQPTQPAQYVQVHLQPHPPLPVQPVQALPLQTQQQSTSMFQGGSVSLHGVLTQEQVSALNSRLVGAGLQAVGQVVGGAVTCNPVALVAGCAMLVGVVTGEFQAVQCFQQRIGRVTARCGAMVPALQKLQQVLSPPQSASLDSSLVESMAKALLMLAQVLMGLEHLLAQLQGGSGNRLAHMLRALKGQCHQQQLDDLEQDLRDCLQQLTGIIGISAFTRQVAEALQGRQELQVTSWAEQNAEDRKCDLEQLEGQVLAVAGGVQALQLHLTRQAMELDGRQVVLNDVLQWLQRMHAGSAVIAGHLQELHRKVDSIQDDVSAIRERLEQLMLQGRQQQNWSTADRLPQLAIAASRIDRDALRKAMDNAASGAFGKVVQGQDLRLRASQVHVLQHAAHPGDPEGVHPAVHLPRAHEQLPAQLPGRHLRLRHDPVLHRHLHHPPCSCTPGAREGGRPRRPPPRH